MRRNLLLHLLFYIYFVSALVFDQQTFALTGSRASSSLSRFRFSDAPTGTANVVEVSNIDIFGQFTLPPTLTVPSGAIGIAVIPSGHPGLRFNGAVADCVAAAVDVTSGLEHLYASATPSVDGAVTVALAGSLRATVGAGVTTIVAWNCIDGHAEVAADASNPDKLFSAAVTLTAQCTYRAGSGDALPADYANVHLVLSVMGSIVLLYMLWLLVARALACRHEPATGALWWLVGSALTAGLCLLGEGHRYRTFATNGNDARVSDFSGSSIAVVNLVFMVVGALAAVIPASFGLHITRTSALSRPNPYLGRRAGAARAVDRTYWLTTTLTTVVYSVLTGVFAQAILHRAVGGGGGAGAVAMTTFIPILAVVAATIFAVVLCKQIYGNITALKAQACLVEETGIAARATRVWSLQRRFTAVMVVVAAGVYLHAAGLIALAAGASGIISVTCSTLPTLLLILGAGLVAAPAPIAARRHVGRLDPTEQDATSADAEFLGGILTPAQLTAGALASSLSTSAWFAGKPPCRTVYSSAAAPLYDTAAARETVRAVRPEGAGGTVPPPAAFRELCVLWHDPLATLAAPLPDHSVGLCVLLDEPTGHIAVAVRCDAEVFSEQRNRLRAASVLPRGRSLVVEEAQAAARVAATGQAVSSVAQAVDGTADTPQVEDDSVLLADAPILSGAGTAEPVPALACDPLALLNLAGAGPSKASLNECDL